MPFAIGVENLKSGANLGTLLRSAHIFGASLLFTVGRAYVRQAADTNNAYKKIPVMRFSSWDEYSEHSVFSWEHIGVEITHNAMSLPGFTHPKRAVYILGPEDGQLSNRFLAMCSKVVKIPSHLPYCLNVASAGSIIMYDRIAKEQMNHGK